MVVVASPGRRGQTGIFSMEDLINRYFLSWLVVVPGVGLYLVGVDHVIAAVLWAVGASAAIVVWWRHDVHHRPPGTDGRPRRQME